MYKYIKSRKYLKKKHTYKKKQLKSKNKKRTYRRRLQHRKIKNTKKNRMFGGALILTNNGNDNEINYKITDENNKIYTISNVNGVIILTDPSKNEVVLCHIPDDDSKINVYNLFKSNYSKILKLYIKYLNSTDTDILLGLIVDPLVTTFKLNRENYKILDFFLRQQTTSLTVIATFDEMYRNISKINTSENLEDLITNFNFPESYDAYPEYIKKVYENIRLAKGMFECKNYTDTTLRATTPAQKPGPSVMTTTSIPLTTNVSASNPIIGEPISPENIPPIITLEQLKELTFIKSKALEPDQLTAILEILNGVDYKTAKPVIEILDQSENVINELFNISEKNTAAEMISLILLHMENKPKFDKIKTTSVSKQNYYSANPKLNSDGTSLGSDDTGFKEMINDILNIINPNNDKQILEYKQHILDFLLEKNGPAREILTGMLLKYVENSSKSELLKSIESSTWMKSYSIPRFKDLMNNFIPNNKPSQEIKDDGSVGAGLVSQNATAIPKAATNANKLDVPSFDILKAKFTSVNEKALDTIIQILNTYKTNVDDTENYNRIIQILNSNDNLLTDVNLLIKLNSPVATLIMYYLLIGNDLTQNNIFNASLESKPNFNDLPTHLPDLPENLKIFNNRLRNKVNNDYQKILNFYCLAAVSDNSTYNDCTTLQNNTMNRFMQHIFTIILNKSVRDRSALGNVILYFKNQIPITKQLIENMDKFNTKPYNVDNYNFWTDFNVTS
jgi:hypothetical protein